MTLLYFTILLATFVAWAYWPRLQEWRTPPEIEEPRHEHITLRCNTCDDTGVWHSTTEEHPTELQHLGDCPDCWVKRP